MHGIGSGLTLLSLTTPEVLQDIIDLQGKKLQITPDHLFQRKRKRHKTLNNVKVGHW